MDDGTMTYAGIITLDNQHLLKPGDSYTFYDPVSRYPYRVAVAPVGSVIAFMEKEAGGILVTYAHPFIKSWTYHLFMGESVEEASKILLASFAMAK